MVDAADLYDDGEASDPNSIVVPSNAYPNKESQVMDLVYSKVWRSNQQGASMSFH